LREFNLEHSVAQLRALFERDWRMDGQRPLLCEIEA